MMSWARKRRENGQRGGVLIELAMVVLPLMTILLGMVEIGGMWKDKSTVIQASRQGARVVTTSSIATTETADQQALLAVLAGIPQGLSGGAAIQVRKVIIFDPTLAHPDAVNTAQINGWAACDAIGEPGSGDISVLPRDNQVGIGVANTCNVYLAGNDANRNSLSVTDANGISSAANWGNNLWNDDFRNRSQAINSLTEVGVYVELYRPWITGFFPGDGQTISGYTIMTVEPAGL